MDSGWRLGTVCSSDAKSEHSGGRRWKGRDGLQQHGCAGTQPCPESRQEQSKLLLQPTMCACSPRSALAARRCCGHSPKLLLVVVCLRC